MDEESNIKTLGNKTAWTKKVTLRHWETNSMDEESNIKPVT